MVELTLAIPIFVLLTFGAIDSSRLFYTYLTLENAVRKAGRFGITGQNLIVNGVPLSRNESIAQIVLKKAQGIVPDVGTLCIQPLVGADCSAGYNAGNSGEFFIISVSKTVVFTPLFGSFSNLGQYQIRVGATFRNEAF